MVVNRRNIEALAQSVVELSKHRVIWRELTNKDYKTVRESTFKDYEDFFTLTVDAHFLAFCIKTSALYDKSPDVISIPNELEDIQDEALKKTLKEELRNKNEFISRVKKVRHKVFAHRDLVLDPSELFKEARIRPDQMKSFTNFAQLQVGRLLEYFGGDTCNEFVQNCEIFEENAREDTARMIALLVGKTN